MITQSRRATVVLLAHVLAVGCYDAHGNEVPAPMVDGSTPAPDAATALDCDAEGEPLPPSTIAARMASFLWDAPPHRELLDAAERGELAARDGVATHARRMLADPRASQGLEALASRWLELSARDSTPLFREETMRFFVEVVSREPSRTLETMLLADWSIRNGELDAWYGGPSTDAAWTRTPTEHPDRIGVLTHASMLQARSIPSVRGRLVQSAFFCRDIDASDEPPGAEDPVELHGSYREQLEMLTSPPECITCHRHMDPIGFSLDGFGRDGRARSADSADYPIDSSGAIYEADVAGTFEGPRGLAQRLAESDDVRRCVTTRWLEHALGHPPDACTFEHAYGLYAGADYDLRELLVAITTSHGFLRR